MNEPHPACADLGPEVTALLRGELTPAEEAPVRAHLAACGECAALARDLPRIRAAAASRPSALPDAASRARLDAALDAAAEEVEAEESRRGPILRLLDAGARRYATSRRFRFLTYSVAVHAAAAVAIAVWLGVEYAGRAPGQRPALELSQNPGPPPLYPQDPLTVPEPNLRFLGALPEQYPLVNVFPDPPEATSPRRYPTEEFRSFAGPRFRPDRGQRLARVYGAEQAPRVEEFVSRAVKWLADAQESDGTWASGNTGVTAVSTLALLGDGRTAQRPGPYRDTVRRAVEALVRSVDAFGAHGKGPVDDAALRSHAAALVALSEAYGLDYGLLLPATRQELQRSVQRGLDHALDRRHADGSFGCGKDGDVPATLMALEAFDSARRAGFAVDAETLEKGAAWLGQRLGSDGRLVFGATAARQADATLTAGALALGKGLHLPAEARDRMRAAVIADARSADLQDLVLFRSSLLELLAASPDATAGDLAPALARSIVDSRDGPGALATARTIRALTAPYRASAP